jgi:hypothetical protein
MEGPPRRIPPRRLAPPDPFIKLRTRVATNAAQPNHRKAHVAWAWRQFCCVLGELLQTLLVLVYAWEMLDDDDVVVEKDVTYSVRAAVRSKVCGKRNGGAEGEEHAQRIHGDIDDRDAELLNERCWQEVEQGEQPPDADEEGVVDNRVCAVVCAVNVAAHESNDEDGAD